MRLSEHDFAFIRALLSREAGIHLEASKSYLVQARLRPVLERSPYAQLAELLDRVRGGDAQLKCELIEAMTIHETSFFRDGHPFETLREVVLPALREARGSLRRLHIWSAACSSGQEPYSVAMLLREHFPELAGWHIDLRATDLSESILEDARQGRFNQVEINRGLPTPLLLKYFRREGMSWRLDERIRQMVRFEQLNLTRPWPTLPYMDVIFLRNVLIYFDVQTKQAILERALGLLKPDGYLFLGGCETAMFVHDGWEALRLGRSIAYRKKRETSSPAPTHLSRTAR